MASIISAGTTAGTALNVTPDTSGDLAFQTQAGANTITVPNATGTLATTAQLTRFKNRIINGDMRIDQRNAGASVTPSSSQYLIDRWQYVATAHSKLSFQTQTSVVPVGFSNAMKITTVSSYSVAAGDFIVYQQQIEGFNVADLNWGTANAKTITLSFQVQSSLTGTFGGYLTNGTNARTYPFTYSISSANTWTTVSVTIAGDTTGTWAINNTSGIQVGFSMGTGSTYTGTAGSWATATYLGASGQVNLVGTSGATFYITGVQLEVGSSATGFEYADYGTQLVQCQRYYEKTYDMAYAQGSATSAGLMAQPISSAAYPRFVIPFQVRKRTAPSLRYWDPNGTENQWVYWNNGSVGYSGFSNQTITETSMSIELNNGTTFSVRANVAGQWAASAEL